MQRGIEAGNALLVFWQWAAPKCCAMSLCPGIADTEAEGVQKQKGLFRGHLSRRSAASVLAAPFQAARQATAGFSGQDARPAVCRCLMLSSPAADTEAEY